MGTIRCSTCDRAMKDEACSCGKARCYIAIYWKGKPYKIWHYYDGMPLDYGRADSMLGEIRTAISKRTFNPLDYTKSKERRFDAVISKWLDFKDRELARGNIRPSSVYSINKIVFNHLKYFNDYNVREINRELISEFIDSLSNVKHKTQRNILVVLKSFFKWMHDRGTVTAIPAFPKMEGDDDSKERIALDYDDQQELLKKVPEIHRDIIEFGMETGLRVGELIALQVGDIDIRRGRAIIQRTLSGNVIIESTKGGTKKPIPLSERAIEILIPHLREKTPKSWCFVNPVTNNRYGINRLNRVWRKATGLDVTYYEASRHSFVTQCVDSGADALQVKELARHSDVRTTQKYYHGDMKRLRDVVNRRGKVIPYSFPADPKALDSRE